MTFLSRFIREQSFQRKINLGLAVIIVFLGLLVGTMSHQISSRAVLQETLKRGQALAVNLSARAVESILSMNFLRLTNLATDMAKSAEQKDIRYVFIMDAHGQVLAHTFRHGFPTALRLANPVADDRPFSVQLLDTGMERIYDFASPVMVGATRLGTVRVALAQATIRAAIDRLMWVNVAMTAGATLLALIFSTFFARTVTRRINALRHLADEVVQGHLEFDRADPGKDARPDAGEAAAEPAAAGDTVSAPSGGDEIQSLTDSFEFMALTLNNHIDELKRSEKDLARQKQLLKTILDGTPDLVTLQDENLIYLAANRAFCDHLGKDEQAVVGATDSDLYDPGQAERYRRENRRILAAREPLSQEIATPAGAGKRWYHVMKLPLVENDKIIGLLTTARDITVVKQYQEKLIHSQKIEDLGRLAGGVAHEINTPLSIILGYAQLLLKDLPPDSAVVPDVAIIERQAQICRKIVSDLLSFSRNSEKSRAPMDINLSIREVVDLVEHIYRLNRIRVIEKLDERIPSINADKERLKQVWMNLLNNAADAIGTDGAITIQSRLCDGARLEVVVADTGSGIAAEDLGKVFEPFFTTKPVDKGTGLGLSVIFGIVQDHGGRINAVSPIPEAYREALCPPVAGQRGPGSLFGVELPLTGEALPPEERPEPVKQPVIDG